MSRIAVLVVMTGLLASQPGAAVNLLANPGFNTDLSGWQTSSGPNFGTTTFDPTLDANGNPASGSAKTVAQFSTAATTGVFLTQCYETPAPGATYTYGGKMFIPAGQVTTGTGIVLISLFDAPGCGVPSGNLLLFDSRSVTTVGAWTQVANSVVAPPGTKSIWFTFQTAKTPAGGSFQLNYDDAVLDGPAPPIAQIPALDGRGLALLALLLSAAAVLILGRR